MIGKGIRVIMLNLSQRKQWNNIQAKVKFVADQENSTRIKGRPLINQEMVEIF